MWGQEEFNGSIGELGLRDHAVIHLFDRAERHFQRINLLEALGLFADVLYEAVAALIEIPEQRVARFAISSRDDPDLVGAVIARNADGVFACAKVLFGKSDRQGIIADRPPVPAAGLLTVHEFESLTGPVQGVEVLNEQIHFGNVTHSHSFSVEAHASVASSVAAKARGRDRRGGREGSAWNNGPTE